MSTFCQSAYKKLPCINFSHKPKFQPLKSAEGFLYEICLQRSPIFKHHCYHFEQNLLAARLHFCDFILSARFCPNGFQRAFQLPLWINMAPLEPYYFEPNNYPNLEMIALETVTVSGQICLEIHLERLKL